jgi:hypothetical protein
MLGAPDGSCLVGNGGLSEAQWKKHSADICGGKGKSLQAPSAFLTTGHVDELVFFAHKPGRPPPCDYAVLVASPSAALDALQGRPDDLFFSAEKATQADQAARVAANANYKAFCQSVIAFLRGRGHAPAGPAGGTRSESWLRALVAPARAAAWWDWSGSDGADVSECAELKNKDVLAFLNSGPAKPAGANSSAKNSGPRLARANLAIQAQMTELKSKMAERFSKALPGCVPDFVDVPDLFMDNVVEVQDGSPHPRAAGAVSILPNPANAQQFGDRFIYPEPGNSAFRAAIERKLGDLKLKGDPVDTFSLHLSGGNAHCAVNAIRYCSPVAGR